MSSTSAYRFPRMRRYEEYEGVELIPVRDRRLERIDVSGTNLPFYKDKKNEKLCLYHITNLKKYTAFASDLQHKNRTRILDRPTTEACWMGFVTTLYHAWDPRAAASESEDPHIQQNPWRLKVKYLEEAQDQIACDDAEWYWNKKARENPGLNVSTATELITNEELLNYNMWMLGKEDLPNSELNKDDLAVLGLGIEGGYVLQEGDRVLEDVGSNEEQSNSNLEVVVEEDRMDLD